MFFRVNSFYRWETQEGGEEEEEAVNTVENMVL